MEKAIAVIDIGMTNKKIALFDGKLRMLDSSSRGFAPVMVDGIPAHDLAGMEEWFLDELAKYGANHPIAAIAVTTHGATMACVGADGNSCAPCFCYTHEPGPDFQERFYRMAGDKRELQLSTGTPPLSAMINPAKGIFFLKERYPEALARSRVLLNYPQYWGYRLTGAIGAEGTYSGCHSYLWDWQAGTYSSVADKLGIRELLPFPLRGSFETLGAIKPEIAKRTGLSPDTIVTMGIHDSNASLLPHLAKREGRDFVLNSTGTWCVLMHPQKDYGYAAEELGKIVYFNRSAYGDPVKTAIFLGGMEYEAWSRTISELGAAKALGEPDPETYRSVLESASEFILPEFVPGSGQFPGSLPRAVQDGREYALADIQAGMPAPPFLLDGKRARALLNISLAFQTQVAFGRSGGREGTDIVTEGGFRKNSGYNALLAAAPGSRVYLTDIQEATSLGAAMTAVAALEGVTPRALADRFDVEYKAVKPMENLAGLAAYRKAWLSRVGA
jgi:L-fuculokinase